MKAAKAASLVQGAPSDGRLNVGLAALLPCGWQRWFTASLCPKTQRET